MLQPKRTKFRIRFIQVVTVVWLKGTEVSFGRFGLESCWSWSSNCSRRTEAASSCDDASH